MAWYADWTLGRRTLALGLVALSAWPTACRDAQPPEPKAASQQARAQHSPAPPADDATLVVRISTEAVELVSPSRPTGRSIPLDERAGPAIAQVLEQPEAAATKPDARLTIDDDVRVDALYVVVTELLGAGFTELEADVTTAAGTRAVPLQFPTLCGCIAEQPLRICVHPELTLSVEGAAVGFFPARAGPCRSAMLRARDADAVIERPAALDRRRRVVESTPSCAEQSPRPIDGALETLLRRTYALAPGCPYAALLLEPDVPWASVEPALALLALDLGWSVTLETPSQADPCEATIEASALPDPWPGVATETERCARSTP